MSSPPRTLWDYVDLAIQAEARTVHLHPGTVVMMRASMRELEPILPGSEPLDVREIMALLSRVVDPDRWDTLDQTGQGELTLNPAEIGRPVRLSLYRSSGMWSAVIFV